MNNVLNNDIRFIDPEDKAASMAKETCLITHNINICLPGAIQAHSIVTQNAPYDPFFAAAYPDQFEPDNPNVELWHLEWLEITPKHCGGGKVFIGKLINQIYRYCTEQNKIVYMFIEPVNGTNRFYSKVTDIFELECIYSASPFNCGNSGFYWKFSK